MSSHAASRPQPAPAPPPEPALAPAPRVTPRLQPAPAPRTARWRAPLLRALLFAFGLLVVGGALATAWAISTTTTPREAPAKSRSVALGFATVAVPAEWQPEALSASGVAGLPQPAVSFATVPGLQAHAVAAVAPADRSAEVALERILGPLGTPRRSRVAGRPARTFAARPVAGDRVAEATLAPVAAGTLVVLCIAKSASWTGAAGCADDLGAS